jgi:hypothetical protein
VRHLRFFFSAALATAVALGGSAAAGAPGSWDTLAAGDAAPAVSQELGLARTADGTLHVAWREGDSVVRARAISPAGRLGPMTTVASGLGLGADPTLVSGGGALRAFFSAGSPVEGLLSATAPQAGSPWSAPALVVDAELVYARTVGVTAAADGTPLQTWYTGGDIAVHRGLSGGPVFVFGQDGSNSRPNIATDTRTGKVLVVWCNFGGANGVFALGVDAASGAPAGSLVKLPGSTTNYQGATHSTCVLESEVSRREPLVARVGGGFYVAGMGGYPTLDRVLVWRLDSSGTPVSTIVAAAARNVPHTEPAIAAAPDGRIWVAWLQPIGTGGRAIVARRSNRAGTVFGAPVTAAAPPGGIGVGTVNLSAQADRVDVVAILGSAATGAKSLRHTQLYPGLTLVRRAAARRSDGSFAVTFAALDAGEPVTGARVRAGTASGLTSGSGSVTLVVPRGTVRATASKAGYVAGRLRFRCC